MQGQPGGCLSCGLHLLGTFCWAEAHGTVSAGATKVAACRWQLFQLVCSIPGHANYLQGGHGEANKLLHTVHAGTQNWGKADHLSAEEGGL